MITSILNMIEIKKLSSFKIQFNLHRKRKTGRKKAPAPQTNSNLRVLEKEMWNMQQGFLMDKI